MKLLAMSAIAFTLVCGVAARRHKVYQNCRYDKTRSWKEPGNYLNCSLDPQNIRNNKYDCCEKTNGGIKCCDPNDKFDGDPNLIWAGIGILGSALLISCFLYNWCDVHTFPCLKKYEKQINRQRQFWQSVANCTCCQVDPSQRQYESTIRQVGLIHNDEHQVCQFGKGDGEKIKFYYVDSYEC